MKTPKKTVVAGIILTFGALMFQAIWLGSLREVIAKSTDKRCKAMEELISAIKIVKMYCWESAFLEKIINFRKNEISNIKKRNYGGHITHRFLTSFGRILTVAVVLVSMATLTVSEFKSADIFVAQQFITDLNWNFGLLFWAVFLLREAKVSIERFQELMLADEKSLKEDKKSDKLEVSNITASWPKEEKSILNKVSVTIKPGSLVALVGQVGSGKSSFLSLLLNEMEKSGDLSCPTNIAYVPQEAWIFGGTIRENILVGRPFNSEKYEKVIEASSLVSDFSNFKHNDQTLVGEKGVTLSGGQRARINLARALYTDADLYLLDDPLAAVDTKVVNDLYENAITKYLEGKTRILVTHHVNLLTNADQIICLDSKSGEISFAGTYNQIKNSGDSFLKNLVAKNQETGKNDGEKKSKVSAKDVMQDEQTEFLLEEKKKTGTLGWQYFVDYFLLCGSKLHVFSWIILLIATIVSTVFTELQLANVGNTGDEIADSCFENAACNSSMYDQSEFMNTMYWYLGLIAMTIFLQVIAVVNFVNVTLATSQNTHDISVASVLRTSMDFFYENPVGRILNRFTKDTDVLDDELIGQTDEAVYLIIELCSILAITCISNWFAIILVVPMFAGVIYLRQMYVRTSREVLRIEGTLRSPVNTTITEAATGRMTINAYRIENFMIEKFNSAQNRNGSAWVLIKQLISWLQFRLDCIAVVFYGCAATMLIYLSLSEKFNDLFNLTPALIGLTLSKVGFSIIFAA